MLRYFDNSRQDKNFPYVIFSSDRNNVVVAKVADVLILNTVLQNMEGLENDEFDNNDFLESNQCSVVDNHVTIHYPTAPKGWAHIDADDFAVDDPEINYNPPKTLEEWA